MIKNIFSCSSALFILLLLAGCASTKVVLSPREVRVTEASFSVITVNSLGFWREYESNIVPLKPNESCYQWRLELMADKSMDKLNVKVMTRLPAPLKFLYHKGDTELLEDKKTIVTTTTVAIPEGWDGDLRGGSCISWGDPAGNYKIEIYIEDKLVKTFDFVVK